MPSSIIQANTIHHIIEDYRAEKSKMLVTPSLFTIKTRNSVCKIRVSGTWIAHLPPVRSRSMSLMIDDVGALFTLLLSRQRCAMR